MVAAEQSKQHDKFMYEESLTTGSNDDSERDEVKEIQKLSQQDTKRIRIWRVLVTLGLLATGVAVVASSYTFLSREEHNNFEQAVSSSIIMYPLRMR
jgi:uncharacterized membrane protein YcjF (UPF0283 family)